MRVKVVPPSVDSDAPDMLIGLALRPRESLYATRTSCGLSGLAQVNVSDWEIFGDVSVPVIRLTSPKPYNGMNNSLRAQPMRWKKPFAAEPFGPPSIAPQAIMIAPARKFSCLSMPSPSILEQSNPTGTRGSWDTVIMW